MVRAFHVLSAIALVLPACSDSAPAVRPLVFGGDTRPVTLKPPTAMVDGQAYPLVLVLHGYGASGILQAAVFQSTTWNDRAYVLAPDGLVDSTGKQYWNADPACCDLDHTGVDDSSYLAGLIADVRAAWPVSDVYIMGHSNGGFMAYRMACDHAGDISAILSLAGDAASTPSACTPSQPVNVLHLHGTADDTVPFAGAMTSTDQWAAHDGCGTTRTALPGTQDLDQAVAGPETTAAALDGCPAGGAVEQWTLTGSGHIPSFNTGVGSTLFAWLDAHRRP